MVALPLELWTIIIKRVARTDLKSCRLVNWQICYLATPALFSILYVALDHDSSSCAAKIVSFPDLSSHVKTLVVHVKSSQDHYNQIRSDPQTRSRSGLQSYDADRAGELGSRRRQWVQDPTNEVYQLQYLLARLSNLTSIEIRSTNGGVNTTASCYSVWPAYDLQSTTGHFLIVLFALAKNGPSSTTSLKCASLDWGFFATGAMQAPAYRSLDQLRHLHLDFAMTYRYSYLSLMCSVEDFAHFFKATSGLEVLILDFGAYDQYDLADGAADFGNTLFTCMRWPRLRAISLAGFIFEEQRLLEFVRRHPTLRDLRLCYICLQAGSAISTIHGLHQYAHLDNLSFHAVYDDGDWAYTDSVWEGRCICSDGSKDAADESVLPGTSLSRGRGRNLRCVGYRSEEWFGGDGSWCACEGTRVENSIASIFGPQTAKHTAEKSQTTSHES